MIDVAIVGSGVAGLAAGLYAGRYELETELFSDFFGGATASAWTIENYPGFESIDGYDLIMKMRAQVEKIGGKITEEKVEQIEKRGETFVLTAGGNENEAKTIIFAQGAARRKLGLPKEEEFSKGKGVHYCTTCDGPLYKGKTIAIIGGGDAAIKGANLAVQYAEKIYIIEMTDHLNPEPVNMARLQPFIDKGKVEVILKTTVKEILGEERVTGLKLDNGKELTIDGLFVEVGAIPDVELAKNLGVELDEKGYIKVDNDMSTNVPGVYAAGDTTNFFGGFKQIVTAAAMGSVAATSAFRHIPR